MGQFDLNHLKKNSLYPSGKGVTTQPKMRLQICLGFVIMAALTSTVFGDKDADKNVDPAREPRIFYYYYTTKMTKLVTVTKQGVSTCLSSAQKQKKATTLCKGRKKRMTLSDLKYNRDPEYMQGELDSTFEDSSYVREARSSVDGSEVNHDEGSADVNRVERALTIWSTDYETLTLTSTNTLSKWTLSVSVFCTTSGFAETCFF